MAIAQRIFPFRQISVSLLSLCVLWSTFLQPHKTHTQHTHTINCSSTVNNTVRSPLRLYHIYIYAPLLWACGGGGRLTSVVCQRQVFFWFSIRFRFCLCAVFMFACVMGILYIFFFTFRRCKIGPALCCVYAARSLFFLTRFHSFHEWIYCYSLLCVFVR